MRDRRSAAVDGLSSSACVRGKIVAWTPGGAMDVEGRTVGDEPFGRRLGATRVP